MLFLLLFSLVIQFWLISSMSSKNKIVSIVLISLLGVYVFIKVKLNTVKYLQIDAQRIATLKSNLKKGDVSKYTQKSYHQLLVNAEALLKVNNVSVMDKALTPPSKNKHDYLSLNRYFWPNPATKDSLPWILKDGKVNPYSQTSNVDRKRLQFLGDALYKLSLAYELSGKEAYAEKGISMMATWFLEGATYMNPNLKHAQIVPGNVSAQRSGILDGQVMASKIIDAITIFSKSEYWNPKNTIYINRWFEEYLLWLTTSKIGKHGAKQINNHASWYYFQTAAIALHLGQNEIVEAAIKQIKILIPKQFNKEGRQVFEVHRTKPFAYSIFNLEGLVRLCMIAEKKGVNLLSFQTKEGKSIAAGIRYLLWASNFNKLVTHNDPEILESLVLVLDYFQHTIPTSEAENKLIKETFSIIKRRIKETNASEPFDYFYLLNETK